MSKNKNPLEFQLEFNTENPQLCKDVFQTGESFDVTLTITAQKQFNHRGIDFEFATELQPKVGKVVKFQQVLRHLADNGSITKSQTFNIPKLTIEENCQTYTGESFTLRHWIRVSVKKLIGSVDFERELVSYQVAPPLKKLEPMCVRVAVQDSIRIDLLIARRQVEIGDVITGAAHFLLVNLKVKTFTVTLLAQEYMEYNGKTQRFKNRVHTWEITDGAPVKSEIIPFRLYLDPLHLNASGSNPKRGFSVTHFLHFTIVTMSNEKYFKDLQIKIVKWPQLPFIFTDNVQVAAPIEDTEEI